MDLSEAIDQYSLSEYGHTKLGLDLRYRPGRAGNASPSQGRLRRVL
ncbi:MAG: hypothetical protein CM15mV33_280 [uncultured marine virus]|nr:MAG: hypothetical protein CM15mV33_280 [uncultured marine virus]